MAQQQILKVEVQKAMDLISDPKHWTTKANGRDRHGKITLTRDADAVCWCALGAVIRINSKNGVLIVKLLNVTAKELGYPTITALNDFGGHEVVMQVFGLTIAKL